MWPFKRNRKKVKIACFYASYESEESFEEVIVDRLPMLLVRDGVLYVRLQGTLPKHGRVEYVPIDNLEDVWLTNERSYP